MGDLNIEEIIEATGGRVVYGQAGSLFTGLSIDSRTIKRGEVFVAIKGERFDGHEFLRDALSVGDGAIVSTVPSFSVESKTLILVGDTIAALQGVARYMRVKSRTTVVGITGTNGKSTTKEMTASILGISHRVMKNKGNLNNHIGLPLSLTGITGDDEFAVLEMGASAGGDIKVLCDIALPDLGIITNIGPGHLEGFGSLEQVRSTKLELFDAARTVVLNADDLFLMEGAARRAEQGHRKIVTFGIVRNADVYAKDIRLEDRRSFFTLVCGQSSREIALPVPGRFNIYNALAAAALCCAAGSGIDDIQRGLESFTGLPMRLEFKELQGATVISDVYNANPASMEEGLRELVRLRGKRAIAVLGDMLELGTYGEEEHRKLGRVMSDLPVDIFIAVGPLMSMAAEEISRADSSGLKQTLVVPNPVEAGILLRATCREGDTVLVKGSRGMGMEQVLEGRPEGGETVRLVKDRHANL